MPRDGCGCAARQRVEGVGRIGGMLQDDLGLQGGPSRYVHFYQNTPNIPGKEA